MMRFKIIHNIHYKNKFTVEILYQRALKFKLTPTKKYIKTFIKENILTLH